jgi:hypothetical protein
VLGRVLSDEAGEVDGLYLPFLHAVGVENQGRRADIFRW